MRDRASAEGETHTDVEFCLFSLKLRGRGGRVRATSRLAPPTRV